MEEKLISVVVISYNSADFVVETLDSIYQQTYHNIELIVTDDASTDNTCNIVDEWMNNHRKRFTKVKVLYNDKNRGCTANLNAGLRLAEGEYVYTIAADDIMYPDTIENKLRLALKYPNRIVITRVTNFGNPQLCEIACKSQEKGYRIAEYGYKKQYRELLKNNFVCAPGVAFFKKDTLQKVDYYDEHYRMMEDYPMWIKLMKQGYSFVFEDVLTVKYRIHKKSLSHDGTVSAFGDSYNLFWEKVVQKELIGQHMYYWWLCSKIGNVRYGIAKRLGPSSLYYKLSYLFYLINPRVFLRGVLNKLKLIGK